jgi:abequosyltransferase
MTLCPVLALNTPKISICIPTYQRCVFLKVLLQALIEQHDDSAIKPGLVEICISDNASTDGTTEMVQELATRCPWIRYARHDQNQGVDHNILTVASMAKGEWIWFMGSDDLPSQGALATALDALGSAAASTAIILWGRDCMELDGGPLPPETWHRQAQDGDIVDLRGPSGLGYLTGARTIACIFSYLSVITVRSDQGSGYAHVPRLLAVALAGGRMCIRTHPIVVCRMGNDSILRDLGRLRRYLIDFEGYHLIGADLIQDRTLRIAWWSVLWTEHGRLADVLQLCGPFQAFFTCRLWWRMDLPWWRVLALGAVTYPRARTTFLYYQAKHRLKMWLMPLLHRS